MSCGAYSIVRSYVVPIALYTSLHKTFSAKQLIILIQSYLLTYMIWLLGITQRTPHNTSIHLLKNACQPQFFFPVMLGNIFSALK
jgi:hypothetical protein